MEHKEKKQLKRKKLNLGVKRKFQMWLLIRIVGVIIVSSLVAVLILYFYSRKEISSSFYSAHIQIRRVSDLLLPVMAVGAFVSLLSGLILAIFLPQKLAGPVYRVQKGLGVIKNGDLTELIVLRDNDILFDLAESVNEATTNLRGRIQEVKEIQRELDQVINSLDNKEAVALLARQNDTLDLLRTQKTKNTND
jgi:methyl-accepting chemotaxis protein